MFVYFHYSPSDLLGFAVKSVRKANKKNLHLQYYTSLFYELLCKFLKQYGDL